MDHLMGGNEIRTIALCLNAKGKSFWRALCMREVGFCF
jgi:hypothetical protein